MPVFSPVKGSNLDFTSPLETLNAIQRNPQLRRQVGTGGFSAYALYAVVVPTGTCVVYSVSAGVEYGVAAPGLVFDFGAPLFGSPGQTACNASSSGTFTVIYK